MTDWSNMKVGRVRMVSRFSGTGYHVWDCAGCRGELNPSINGLPPRDLNCLCADVDGERFLFHSKECFRTFVRMRKSQEDDINKILREEGVI